MSAARKRLSDVFGKKNRVEELKGSTPERVITEMLEHLNRSLELSSEDLDSIKRAILAREREASTGIGHGLAIPHMKNCPYVEEISGVFGRSLTGVEYGSTDAEPVHLFFLILTPPDSDSEHVRIMKEIVLLHRDRKTLRYLIKTDSFANLSEIFQELDEQVD